MLHVSQSALSEDWLGGKTASTVKPNVGAQSAKIEVVVFSSVRLVLLSPLASPSRPA